MILFCISIILFVLTLFGVNIPYWVVSLPAMVAASFSLFLFMKTEVEYLREYNKQAKEEEPQE